MESAFVGVDVGGTHTDVHVVLGDAVSRGKALTTYDDFSRGVLDAIQVAADDAGIGLTELLQRTQLLVNATTIVTNAITEMAGAKVGVLVTAGFRDTFRIAGGPRRAVWDDHQQTNVPDLVDRRGILEIAGRMDSTGIEIVPLSDAQIQAAARQLVDEEGAEALAVCFLNSHVAPNHELRAGSLIQAMYPDLFVSLSHRLHRVRGETRRWTTAVLNSFVHAVVQSYLETLASNLREAGLASSRVAFFQGLGGGISKERAEQFPLALLGSGPAGGAIGANVLGRNMGATNILIGDMGGTSFDTGVIVGNDIHIERNIDVGPFRTGVNRVDIISIGAGGGSIASVSERGVPQVGPASAGSTPGPACYGRGGEHPTVTDAMVVLGFIDPGNYLGGRFKLHKELAIEAIETKLAPHFGWSAEEAAAAIHDIVVSNMANALHEVSVQKGYDPREFLFLAYGGTLPAFAIQIARQVGIANVVIPHGSSVFCAQGVVAADFVLRYDQTVSWSLDDPAGASWVNDISSQMIQKGNQDMQREGFAADAIAVVCSGDFRFDGQTYELTLSLPTGTIAPDDVPDLSRRFFELYERVYGEGTAWTGVAVELLTYTVTVVGRREQPRQRVRELDPIDPSEFEKNARTVYLPSARAREVVPVYDGERFRPGSTVEGPAIIDESDTTIFVPPNVIADRDGLLNYRLRSVGG